MAFDAFLQFYKAGALAFNGETTDPDFVGAVEISEFSFGAENTISIGSSTTGAGAGKATFKEFTIKKLTDTGSPSLLIFLAEGKHYDNLTLSLRKGGAGGDTSGAVYLKFEFGMVMVKSIEWSGATGDDVPSESVVFEFGEIRVTYCQQDTSGALKAPIIKAWSRLTNRPKLTVLT
jgi:type VI secretion system secreted protein Hcp